MPTIALDLLLFVYGIAAPGIAIAQVLLPDRAVFERLAVGLALSLFAVPLVHFVVAVALSTHVSKMLVTADATAVLVLCAAILARRAADGRS